MNKLNHKKLKSSKGSSTVLVMLIVLTVVLFGVMNMLTVYTSYKISRKSLNWTKDYYKLESKAHIFANNIKKEIGKYEYGEKIDEEEIIKIISENLDENMDIVLNKKLMKKPIDKTKKIVQNNYIDIEAYFYKDEDKKRAFYISLKIPKIRSEEPYEISSWKNIAETFEYDFELEFDEIGENVLK